jgi:DNA-binding response OmpR family regulator
MRERRSDSATKQLPPLVILVGEAARDDDRIHQLLDAGSVIVIARSAATVDAWLPRELLERVEHEPPHVVITVNKLEVDLTERRARWFDQLLDLTEHELGMLAMLAEDPGRAWRFEELLSKVWGVDFYGDPDMVHAASQGRRRSHHPVSERRRVPARRQVQASTNATREGGSAAGEIGVRDSSRG